MVPKYCSSRLRGIMDNNNEIMIFLPSSKKLFLDWKGKYDLFILFRIVKWTRVAPRSKL